MFNALQLGDTMRSYFIISFFIISLLPGCLTQANQQVEADKLVQEFHTALQNGDWEKAGSYYDAKFFQQQSRSNWQNDLQSAIKKLGDIESFHTITKQKDPRYGGDFYIYITRIQHQHGSSHETMTIFKGLDDERLSISGYKLNIKGVQH